MLDGHARKIGLILTGFTIIPWCLIVAAFAILTIDLLNVRAGLLSTVYDPVTFPYWMVIVGVIPFIVLASVNAIVSQAEIGKILRATTIFVSILLLLSLGMLLFISGSSLLALESSSLRREVLFIERLFVDLLFSGSFLVTILLSGQMILFPFYEEPCKE